MPVSDSGLLVPAILGADGGPQMAVSLMGLLVLIVVGAIAVAFAILLVRAFSPRAPAPQVDVHMPHRRRSGAGPVVALLLAAVVLLGLLLVGSFTAIRQDEASLPAQVATEVEVVQPQIDVSYSGRIEAIPEDTPPGADTVPEGTTVQTASVPENVTDDVSGLPEWTNSSEKTLRDGQVPTVHRVAQSGLYATQDEARNAAIGKVQSEMRNRLSASYPQFASWTIPSHTIKAYCVKQKHLEVRQTQFGEVSEPMYQMWLQYEDSPHVRDPIIAEWQRSAVDGRALLFVAGAGLLALILGTISAGTRMMIAPRGGKGRAAFATVALGVGTGLAAIALFVA